VVNRFAPPSLDAWGKTKTWFLADVVTGLLDLVWHGGGTV